MSRLPWAIKRNTLTIFFGTIFVVALAGQALTGVALYNEEQVSAGLDTISLVQYLTSSRFAVDVTENWQSEYLQFLLFILATVWLVQRGSPESKKLDEVGRESDVDQLVGEYAIEASPAWAKVRGLRLWLFSHSLSLVMATIFFASWLAQSITGAAAYSEERLRQYSDPVTWSQYVALPEFWGRTFQNWQSEFLAVASMVILSVYLRERGSSESKKVGAPHNATGSGG